jgi:hypothetical protein
MIFDDFDDHGFPTDENGDRLSAERAAWRVRAAERRERMDDVFEKSPAIRGTFVLFSQTDAWVDREANVVPLTEIDPSYAANIMRFVDRRATVLWGRYEMARLLWSSTWRAENEIEERMIYDDEAWAMEREGVSMPMMRSGSVEEWQRCLGEWAARKLRETPLMRALAEIADGDRWDALDEFLADA